MKAPLFIVGASRSGTTMLRLILNAHSQIAIPRELKYFNSLPRTIDWQKWRKPELTHTEYEELLSSFLERRRSVFGETEIAKIKAEILDCPSPDLRRPLQVVAEWYARQFGKCRWGEKTPHNLFYVDVLHDMFPDALFIHLVRDPRAVVSSMNGIKYFPHDTLLNTSNWLHSVRTGQRLLNDVIPANQRTIVKYEELVTNPEESIRALCDFVDEDYEGDMMSFYESAHEYMGTVIRTPSITGPITSRNADKWRSKLASSDVATVESLCQKEMTALGYELTGVSLPVWDYVINSAKRIYWKWKMWQHRTRRGYTIHYRIAARFRTPRPETAAKTNAMHTV